MANARVLARIVVIDFLVSELGSHRENMSNVRDCQKEI
jgi:hypothetical protein